MPINILDVNEKMQAQKFADATVQLYAGCKAKGGYTKEAAEFVDTFGRDLRGTDEKIKEVFGVKVDQ